MKQLHGLSGKRLAGAVLIVSGLFFSSFTLANIISGSFTTSSSTNVTVTNLVMNKPSGVVQGDFLLASVAIHDGNSVSVTAPSGWTQILRTDNDTSIGIATYWKVAGASESTNYTWVLSPQTRAQGGITRYSGVDPSNPVDVAVGNAGRSKIATTTSITTSSANEEIVAVYALHVGSANFAGDFFSAPAGMIEKFDSSYTNAGPTLASFDATQASSGVIGSKSSTISGNPNQQRDWAAQTIALRMVAPATIAFNATSTSSNSGGYTTDTGMTGNPISVVGSSTLLLVSLWSNPGLSNPAVSCNGVPMSLIESGNDTGTAVAYIFALRGASSCAPEATWDSSFGFKYMMAVSYTGVDQSADPVTFNNGARLTQTGSYVADLPTDSVASSWVVTFANGGGAYSGMTNGTIRANFPDDAFMTGDSNGVVSPSALYSTTLSYPAGDNILVHAQQIEISPVH